MLELIFQGFMEWAYGLTLECWEYFSSSLLSIMSMDYAYMKSHVPVMVSITQVLLAVGWALLIGNLVFQALKSMAVGLGFEGEDPKLLFTRTFVFAFLLMASPQICEVGLSLTARIIELLEIPDAIDVTLLDEGAFGSLNAAWLLVIIFGLIIMFKVFRLLLEIAERYVILAVLTMTAPLAFAMGGSKSTSEIFGGWCRMFGSMCTLMVTNVIFFKMLLSVLSNVPSGLDIIPWIVLALTIVKVARKADAIITRIGLNPAITGDSLGRGFPGTLTYMVMRSATSHISQIEVSPSVLEPTHDGLTDEERENDFLNILDACELTGFTPGTALVFENAIERLYYSDSYRIGNATLPQSRVRAKLRRLDGMILREAERKLRENQEQNVKNSTAYTMAVLFNCIAESESDLMVDPYLNALSSTA